MSFVRRHAVVFGALAIFALALGLRLGFWSEIRGTALDRWHRLDQTDMATYLEQARRIRVDPLARDPYHPYHAWQRVAPPSKWLEWYGPHTFHQAPAYAYVLAFASRFLRAPEFWIKLSQLVLGSASCVLAFGIARRIAGGLAGAAAGALALAYGPMLYLEPQFLREGPAVFALLAILALLVRHLELQAPDPRRVALSCAGLGIAAGLFATFHEMANVVTLALAISVAIHHGASRRAWAALAPAALLAGYVVGFSPLLARNVAVGAPPFSVSCRTRINFVQANEATAPDGGASFSEPGPNVVRILDQAQGKMWPALVGVWRTYDGDLGLAFANWRQRFAQVWKRPEEPDNTSYVFYRDHSAVLGLLPTFGVLFPLGFAGALVVLAAGVRRARARRANRDELEPVGAAASIWARHARGHLALLLHVVLVAGALSFVHTVARFRLYVVPYFWIYAGVALAILVRELRARRARAVFALAVALLVGAGLQAYATHESDADLYRPMDYATASRLAVEAGEIAEARAFTDEGVDVRVRDPGLYAALAENLERRGELALAEEYYRRALAARPGDPYAAQGLQRVRAKSSAR